MVIDMGLTRLATNTGVPVMIVELRQDKLPRSDMMTMLTMFVQHSRQHRIKVTDWRQMMMINNELRQDK